jgi:hypothetical protein
MYVLLNDILLVVHSDILHVVFQLVLLDLKKNVHVHCEYLLIVSSHLMIMVLNIYQLKENLMQVTRKTKEEINENVFFIIIDLPHVTHDDYVFVMIFLKEILLVLQVFRVVVNDLL